METAENKITTSKPNMMGTAMAIGVGVRTALGNIAVGVAVGAGVGVAIGAGLNARNQS